MTIEKVIKKWDGYKNKIPPQAMDCLVELCGYQSAWIMTGEGYAAYEQDRVFYKLLNPILSWPIKTDVTMFFKNLAKQKLSTLSKEKKEERLMYEVFLFRLFIQNQKKFISPTAASADSPNPASAYLPPKP